MASDETKLTDSKLDRGDDVPLPVDGGFVSVQLLSPSDQTTTVILENTKHGNHSTKPRPQNLLDVANELYEYIQLLVGPLVIMVLLSIFPTVLLVLGLIYKDDCTVNYKIPILFIVLGSCQLFHLWFSCSSALCKKRANTNEHRTEEIKQNCFVNFAPCVGMSVQWIDICLFFMGCVWIFEAYEPIYDDVSNPDYCDKTFYTIAVWFFAIRIVGTALRCCCMACFVLVGPGRTKNLNTAQKSSVNGLA